MTDPYERMKIPQGPVKTFDPLRPFRYLFVGFLYLCFGATVGIAKIVLQEDHPGPAIFVWAILFGLGCIPGIWIGLWTLWIAFGQFLVYGYFLVSLHLWDEKEQNKWFDWAKK